MLTFYFGEEGFLMNQVVRKNKKDFAVQNPQALVEIFEADEDLAEDFLSAISQGGGLFSSKKLVILKDVFQFNKSDQEKILEFLKVKFNGLGDVEVLITSKGKLKSSKLGNFLKKTAKIREFKKPIFSEVEKFISNKLKGVSFDENIVKKLAFSLGSDLWVLDRELEKLINLKLGNKITEKDIEKIGGAKIEAKIFDLIDAIGNKNKKRALELLESLLAQGENAFRILSMVVFQLRNLALVSDCKNKGVFNFNEISKKTGLHPFVAQKTFNQIRFFPASKIKKTYQQIFSIDINSKSGKIDIKEALNDLIIKI